VVPYADPAYASARPTVGVRPENVLHIDGGVGLNPALKGLKSLYDGGQVAIVQGVGYDKPTYSHFENLYVWEYADPKRMQTDGWLGKLLGTQLDSQGHPLAGCALGEVSTPAELRAANATVSVIQSVQEYTVRGGTGHQATARALYRNTPGIYGALFDQMIVTEPSVKICHVVISGFDTHQAESTRQTALLAEVDAAVSAFMQDITAHGQAYRVVLMTWSEFGRRINENGSQDTDHGAAAPLFIVGTPVKGGLYGEQPSLTNTIDSGNLESD
jgi:uncharacterized protein (DUF1501 family)